MMPYTSPRLNAIVTIARFMFGRFPTHSQQVGLYRKLIKQQVKAC